MQGLRAPEHHSWGLERTLDLQRLRVILEHLLARADKDEKFALVAAAHLVQPESELLQLPFLRRKSAPK